MLKTNDKIINIDFSPVHNNQKRVTFDLSGTYLPAFVVIRITCVALKMADKHEEKSGGQKKDDIRKRVELNSASSWDADDLDMFGGIFDRNTYDFLPNEVYEAISEQDVDLDARIT